MDKLLAIWPFLSLISTKPYALLIQSFSTSRSDSQDSELCIEPTFSFYGRKILNSLPQDINSF